MAKAVSPVAGIVARTRPPTSTAKPNTTRRVMTRKEVKDVADPDTLLLIIIHSTVYNCTLWQKEHPGGKATIRCLCGKDATDAFESAHPEWVTPRYLSKFVHAYLAEGEMKIDDATRDFRQLTQKFKDEGFFQTDYTFYFKKIAIYSAIFSAMLCCVFGSDQVVVHAIGGILLGIFWQQIAFFGHDLGHSGVTHDRVRDSWLGLIAANLLSGASLGWWKYSHNVHHIAVNSIDTDPDIQHLPVFAISPVFLKKRIFSTFYHSYMALSETAHLLVAYQHILYYPVMAFARINLYAQSFSHTLGIGGYSSVPMVWQRGAQFLTLVLFWVWLLFLTFHLPTFTSRLLFFVLAHNVAGFLHVQITLSHFCMPAYRGVTYDDATNGFIRTQLAGSLNIDCPPWMDWFHGGLQFQVEHHLWPRMARHKLRQAKPYLEELCYKHNLPYHHAGFIQANCIMLRKLKETAAHADSFSELFWDSLNLSG